ncbi:MAG: ATP-dependent acyl-CoA ligase, partial [Martelella sp.]
MALKPPGKAPEPAATADPALDRNRSVLRYVLDGYAQTQPEAPFVQFWPGPTWTYGELHRRVRLRASALAQAGVKRGGHVL